VLVETATWGYAMPNIREHATDPATEAAFRRGYSLGVQAAIEAIRSRLSDADRRKLEGWISEIWNWRGPGGRDRFEAPPPPALDTAL